MDLEIPFTSIDALHRLHLSPGQRMCEWLFPSEDRHHPLSEPALVAEIKGKKRQIGTV